MPSSFEPSTDKSLPSKVCAPEQVILPVICPPARGNLVAIELVTVVEKLASSPSAAASSLSVFKALGLESTKFDIAVSA